MVLRLPGVGVRRPCLFPFSLPLLVLFLALVDFSSESSRVAEGHVLPTHGKGMTTPTMRQKTAVGILAGAAKHRPFK